MASKPYWGHLPNPKTPDGSPTVPGQFMYSQQQYTQRPPPDATAMPPKTNRASVQTTNTESTISPFASPISSTFHGQGLAPRPPSMSFNRYDPQHQRQQASLDSVDRTRRTSGGHNSYGAHDGPDAPDNGELPPAAPDVPRGPPLSYKMPYTTTAHTAAYNAPRTTRRPDMQFAASDSMIMDDPEHYYTTASGGPPGPGYSRRQSTGDDAASTRHAASVPGGPLYRVPTGGSQTGRRDQKLDSVRSPLQQLEQTLDSINKEEKRARVAAAEQAVREKELQRGVSHRSTEAQPWSRGGVPTRTAAPQATRPQQLPPPQHQQQPPLPQLVRFHESDNEPRPLLRPDVSPIEEAFSHRGPPTHSPDPDALPPPPPPDSEKPRNRQLAASGIPQRNLSFRERAERTDAHLPHAGEDANGQTAAPVLPQRKNSTQSAKLRKDPPGDPWFTKRAEAERTYAIVQPRNAPPLAAYDGPGDGSHALGAEAMAVEHSDAPQESRNGPVPRDERHFSNPHHHHISNFMYHGHDNLRPGQGLYNPPTYLGEWKNAPVGTLSGSLLDLDDEKAAAQAQEKAKAWWEEGGRRRGSSATRPRRAEAFDGEYDESNGPSRFKPPLHLICGPLLRAARSGGSSNGNGNSNGVSNASPDREFWRGSVMIVTRDTDSSYDIAPTLRLFVQPLELLPPPPSRVQELPAEYVDPLVGHPKLGRNGETLYVRPVEELEEAKDLSRDETDGGLFEKTRSGVDSTGEAPGSFAARLKKTELDGEKVGKFKDVRGFRLHAERGVTFWRFNIEVELRAKQQRIAYRINRGPSTGFWVPARDQSMNIMFHSCNGFSLSVNPDHFSGPDPLWRDVLNTHQTKPFHVMIGGGDQLYNDAAMNETKIFRQWLDTRNPKTKNDALFTSDMQEELEMFFLERYAMWFSQGLFSLANSQIPMVNMYDDHDIIDGYGSYPHHFMKTPVFAGLGNVAFKYYMLFQHQSVVGETEESEPSWILGTSPGPYIHEVNHSLFVQLGARVALLAVDGRTERTHGEVLQDETWKRVMDRCYAEIEKGKTEHLLVLLGIPIAYPRLVWLENILTSRLMGPVKLLGKTGLLGNFLNHFDGGVEVLDDLDDHWTAKDHKDERRVILEDLQDLAADRSVRITILSGDVHLAAVGQFYSNPKQNVAKHQDFRYMPNIISSAIVNAPPPDILADVLNKRNKVHHFDKETDESMIPLFAHGVDGMPRNNKILLPHRNWCSIQPYVPGTTPAVTPNTSVVTLDAAVPGPRRAFSRRLQRHTPYGGGDGARPPMSSGLLRTLSQSRVSMNSSQRPRTQDSQMRRTFSMSQDWRPANLFRRLSSRRTRRTPDDGGINGSWGPDSTDDIPQQQQQQLLQDQQHHQRRQQARYTRGPIRRDNPGPTALYGDSSDEDDYMMARVGSRDGRGLRGGAEPPSTMGGAGRGYDEFATGDETYFSVRRRPVTSGRPPVAASANYAVAAAGGGGMVAYGDGAGASAARPEFGLGPEPEPGPEPELEPAIRGFYRTPTGLSTKQMKRAAAYEVNLEGGLEIRLNVEVNPKDPTGITVPYRLVVPRLWYSYKGDGTGAGGMTASGNGATGLKRLLSLGRKQRAAE